MSKHKNKGEGESRAHQSAALAVRHDVGRCKFRKQMVSVVKQLGVRKYLRQRRPPVFCLFCVLSVAWITTWQEETSMDWEDIWCYSLSFYEINQLTERWGLMLNCSPSFISAIYACVVAFTQNSNVGWHPRDPVIHKISLYNPFLIFAITQLFRQTYLIMSLITPYQCQTMDFL